MRPFGKAIGCPKSMALGDGRAEIGSVDVSDSKEQGWLNSVNANRKPETLEQAKHGIG